MTLNDKTSGGISERASRSGIDDGGFFILANPRAHSFEHARFCLPTNGLPQWSHVRTVGASSTATSSAGVEPFVCGALVAVAALVFAEGDGSLVRSRIS